MDRPPWQNLGYRVRELPGVVMTILAGRAQQRRLRQIVRRRRVRRSQERPGR